MPAYSLNGQMQGIRPSYGGGVATRGASFAGGPAARPAYRPRANTRAGAPPTPPNAFGAPNAPSGGTIGQYLGGFDPITGRRFGPSRSGSAAQVQQATDLRARLRAGGLG
jgi:hypothetical protein